MSKVPKNIAKLDSKIYKISNRIRILYHINPTNASIEKERFLEHYRKNRKYVPRFTYRPLDIDQGEMSGELKDLGKYLGNSELDDLYRKKIEEIDNQLLLISSVGNEEKFLKYSILLYGTPSETNGGGGVKPLDIAKIWLSASRISEEKYVPARDPNPHKESVARSLDREARFYGFYCRIFVKDHLSANAAAGENSVVLRGGTLYSKKESIRMCVHEVGFHLLTTYNGKQHKLRIFEIGTPGYYFDQEGGAIWAEEESKAITNYRLAILGARTMGISLALEGADFYEVFKAMHQEFKFSQDDAFYICERVFRGGVYTKDGIYQLGFYNVRNSFRFDVADPYTFINGKMSLKYAPLFEELAKEGYVEKKPKYIPRFMQDEEWINTWRTLSETNNLFKREKFLETNSRGTLI
jgi:uncharacterized protein (TIGR02421 family)